jgi:hypothetical protein
MASTGLRRESFGISVRGKEVLVQLKNECVIINDFGTPLEIAIDQLC